jgi:recombination protein RecR
MAFYILGAPEADIAKFATTLTEVKRVVKFCSVCGNVTQEQVCRICSDPTRDSSTICVVEEIRDVLVIERTREFKGRYHVLGGAISPIDGIGPDDLRIGELLQRIKEDSVTEVIIATDPNLEGEATATYLARQIGALGVKVTRPASGLPVGGDLEFADEVTLGRAFLGRRPVNSQG